MGYIITQGLVDRRQLRGALFHDLLHFQLGFHQGFFSHFALGDVLHGFDRRHQFTLGVVNGCSGKKQPTSVFTQIGKKVLGFIRMRHFERIAIAALVQVIDGLFHEPVNDQVGHHGPVIAMKNQTNTLVTQHLCRCGAQRQGASLVEMRYHVGFINHKSGDRVGIKKNERVYVMTV